MAYVGNDPFQNKSVDTAQLADNAVTGEKIVDDITFDDITTTGNVSGSVSSTGSYGRVEATKVEGTLATAAQTNVTSVGTVTTGVWNSSFGTTSGTQISGSITATSSSIATRFDSRETDMTLATASIVSNESNMTLATASIAAITASVSSLKSTSFAGTAGTETVFSGSAASTGSFGRAIISGDVDINSEGGMVGPIAPWVRLNKINLGSSTSELDITTGFGATYDTYMIVCENVHCGTDNVVLRMRFFIDGSIVDGGGNYNYHVQQSHSGNANYEAGAQDYSGATSMINLIAEQGNAAGESCSGIVYIHAPSVENFQHYAHYYFVGMRTDSSVNMGRGVGGYVSDTDELTGVRFYYSSGNLDDGTFTLYGLSK
jgi:hypothetical protein